MSDASVTLKSHLGDVAITATLDEFAEFQEYVRAKKEVPPRDHGSLVLAAWLHRDIPPRDYLLGSVLCTTSRWFVIGETGVGKTLFGAELGASCAHGVGFLNWGAGRPCRVIYIDGELPVETFKERMQLIASRHGPGLHFFGYNREYLGYAGMPPLNTTAGQIWLWREIEIVKPDLIIFDSIMCLLVGPMSDEATWAPMKPLVCELSTKRIAQIWFNHANDLGKSFGDKTREWEMDTVAKLSKVEGEDGAFQLEFTKARLRTPNTAGQFAPIIVRPSDNWKCETAKPARNGKRGDVADITAGIVEVYSFLADGKAKSPGLDDGRSQVLKVPVADIRNELLNRGYLDGENGTISATSRSHFCRAKRVLVQRGKFAQRNNLFWSK